MIKIFTFSSNRPDFIELQALSFRKNLGEEFEFTVFNNAHFDNKGNKTLGDSDGIRNACKAAGARMIDVERDEGLVARCQAIEFTGPIFNPNGEYSNANVAHAYALCWAWENHIAKEKGAVAIFDSDIFLIQPVKLTDSLYPHTMRNIPDGKPHPDGRTFRYMWPTFLLVDMARMPDPQTLNWWCGRIEDVPVDVGGQTYHYFQAHPDLDVVAVPKSRFAEDPNCDFQPSDYDEFHLTDGTVLHYRSGSNWNRLEPGYHQRKTKWLKRRIG